VSSVPNLIVFSDDSRVLNIAEEGGARIIKKAKEDFSSWTQNFDKTRHALNKKRNRFKVPEFFSEEYICLQLCKADAILEALDLFDNEENVFWIDAGIRNLPKSWKCNWSYPEKIHFLQIGSDFTFDVMNIHTPMVHFAGTFWGGKSKHLQWFCKEVLNMSQNLLAQGDCANDQQIFSMINRRYPERFWGYKSYALKTPIWGLWHFANFNNIFMILQDKEKGNVTFTGLYYIQIFLLFLLFAYFLKCRNIF